MSLQTFQALCASLQRTYKALVALVSLVALIAFLHFCPLCQIHGCAGMIPCTMELSLIHFVDNAPCRLELDQWVTNLLCKELSEIPDKIQYQPHLKNVVDPESGPQKTN